MLAYVATKLKPLLCAWQLIYKDPDMVFTFICEKNDLGDHVI